MSAKILTGKITSVKMQDTILVEVTRRVPHPLYRKLIRKSKQFKVDSKGQTGLEVGQTVKIVATKPISKTKYFKVLETVKK